MTTNPVHLAFIGSGGWAKKYHFPALAYIRDQARVPFDLRLHGIYSLDHADAAAVAAHYGFAYVYESLDALLNDATINAVAVAVTPSALKGVLEHVITRRIPMLSEKPPGISLAEAQYLSDLITVPNVLAFNRRYSPLNQRFKQLLDAMDNVYFVEGHFFRHNRLDDNFMIGTGIHWINFMTYLFGPILAVVTDRFPNPQNATWLRVAQLTFESGLKGILKVFPCSGSQVERLEVHSNAQSLYLHGPLWADPGEIIIENGSERRSISLEAEQPLPEIVRLGIVGEYEEFFQAVFNGTPTRSNFQNAVNAMWAAECMESGQSVSRT